MKKVGMRVIKTAIGAAIAIILAQAIGLSYPYSAAIITILSIQNTRRKSIDVVKQRVKATILSLVIGSFMLLIFGFNAFAFGLYLICFIPLTVKFNASEGISTSAVLVTHLLGEGIITPLILLNEVILMMIGTTIALLANIYMPKILPQLAEDKAQIEAGFQQIIYFLGDKIYHRSHVKRCEKTLFASARELLESAQKRAEQNQENYILIELSYYAQYMEMRFLQFEVLTKLSQTLDKVELTEKQATALATLTEKFAENLHDPQAIINLLSETEHMVEEFHEHPLPKTRAEFLNQTFIFQYLNDFYHLIDIKKTFMDNLKPEEKILEQALTEKNPFSIPEKWALIKKMTR